MFHLLTMEAILIATIGICLSGGLLAWRERPEPGATPLTVLLGAACWWTAALLFQVNATTLPQKVFWINISWIGVSAFPVAWLFFCLAYTGYGGYLERRYVALASVIPALTVAFALTNQYHHLLYTDSALVAEGGTIYIARTPGIWFWVAAGYTYLLGFLGAIPLVGFLASKVSTFRGQSLAVLIGLVTPWTTNVLHLLGYLPTGHIDPTPVAFSVSGIAFLGALTQFQLLDTSPAPIRPARRAILDRMESGAVVLDRKDNVVDINDRATAILGGNPSNPLGRDITSISPQFASVLSDRSGSGKTVYDPGGGEGAYDVSVAEVRDTHGRTTGRLVTLHDITDYVRQQQRLEVLNRFFRHNVRTNSQVIIGQLQFLAEENSQERADLAQAKMFEITEFGDRIRGVLDVFTHGRGEPEPVDFATLLEHLIETLRSEFPEVTVHGADCIGERYVDRVMSDVLENVLDNAARHNTNPDPTVWIDVDAGDDLVRVTVADNGPGIADEELALLREGSETPVNHGSGLGLALIGWGTEIVGGHVEFEENTPDGTVVTLEIPVLRGE